MDGIPVYILLILIFTERIVDGATCDTKFSDEPFMKDFGLIASNETTNNKASEVFTVGWCSNTQSGSPNIDVDFKQSYGISSILVSGPTNRDGNPYPTSVLVKYVPNGRDVNNFVNFPLQGGKLEIKMNQPGTVQSNFGQSIAVRKLQFTIQSYHGDSCLKIDLLGCSLNEVCPGGCLNNGICVMQDTCQCTPGHLGNNCELKECKPEDLGLSTGVIGADDISVSSEDPIYNKGQLGNSDSNKGWCPAISDNHPWVEIKLEQPKAVSVFSFMRSNKGVNEIMTEFEFQYISAIDSSRRFRTFASDIPAMNSTHVFTVTTQPVVVTDHIRIIPSKWTNRACFKLEVKGCDPKQLCSSDWCKNGGTCMGENVCACPSGFVGNQCEKPVDQIVATNLTFVKIEHNVIITTTTTLQFIVNGNVNLNVSGTKPVVTINGTDSYIKLNQTNGQSSCITNLNLCNNGFTFTIDVNFGHLLDNTYIVSSGGHLPGHSGITLYYSNKQLHYIVSTTNHKWTLVAKYEPALHKWQHIEITWNKHLGVELLIDGHSLGSSSRPSGNTGGKVVDLCIGCSHTDINVNVNIQITAIHTWTIDRTELVNAGVKDPPSTTPAPKPTATSTLAKTTTVAKTTVATTAIDTTTVFATSPSPPTCTPVSLGLANGSIGDDQINVSSEDSEYNKAQIGNSDAKKGWCQSKSDYHPWVQIKLHEPKAVSTFSFTWSNKGNKDIMTEFELQYIAAIDTSRRFRTFASAIPAMNSTTVFEVTIIPIVVTDTIKIIPTKAVGLACFKLDISGCDPKALCSNNWCQNGGTCMGENVCLCPKGFLGSRCEKHVNEITVTNMTFVNIENNVIITTTTTLNFAITGTVNFEVVANKPIVTINGNDSFITLTQTTGLPYCVTNVNLCNNGFTFTIDVNFGHLFDNTYIVSSGGHLPGHSGITLYYTNKQLVYIVSTTTQKWTLVAKYEPVLHKWQHIEITWSKHLGVELLIDGHSLGSNSRPSGNTGSNVVDLCIGCSHTSVNVNINIQITGIHSWTIDRTELVNAGVKDPPMTTPSPATTPAKSSSQTTNVSTKTLANGLKTGSTETGVKSSSYLPFTTTENPNEIINSSTTRTTRATFTTSITSTTSIDKISTQVYTTYEVTPKTVTADVSKRSTSMQPTPLRATHMNLRTSSSSKFEATRNNSTSDLPTTEKMTEKSQSEAETTITMSSQRYKNGASTGSSYSLNSNTHLMSTRVSKPTSPPLFLEYNLTFVSIVDNILITPTFNFTLHNKPTLELLNNSHTVLNLNCTEKQYIELPEQGIPCLEDLSDCEKGFTFKITVLFTELEPAKKAYILSSGGDKAGTSGMAIYIQNSQLIFGVKFGFQHWTGTYNMTDIVKTGVWYKLDVSWSAQKGVIVLIDGYQVIKNNNWTPSPITPATNPVLIGKTNSSDETTCMKVKDLFTWTVEREVLVDYGIVQAPKSTSAPTTRSTTTTILTTTQVPVPTYTWNFTSITNNVIIGNHYNLTVHGGPDVSNGGIQINSTTQYIEFGRHEHNCLIKPGSCLHGLTISFTIKFDKFEENTYFFTSGGQLPDGVGLAVIYRFGKIQFILTTVTQSWFINCGKNQVKPNQFHTIIVSWQMNIGLEVFVNNILIETTKVPLPHQSALVNATTVYIGKQPSTSIKVDFTLQLITIWYVHIDILVEQGICKPPVRPTTTTPSQSTKATTKTPVPSASSSRATFTSLITTKGTTQQCPVGCVSIIKPSATTAKPTDVPTQPPVTATSKKPSTTKKPSTKPSPTTTILVPTPDTATPPPLTTRKPIPDYSAIPSLNVTVEKDKNAYIACAFKPTSQKDVQIKATLIIEGKIRLVLSVSGYTGVAIFAVSKVDMHLYNKKIQCSIAAHFIGSVITTTTYYSNIFTPSITVSPNRVIVIEGHSKEFVIVTSTAPPQFYCCAGCKGQCQVHIVGSFHYDRHFQKCGKKVIAQALIDSTKPPNYNEQICGYALTITNWNQPNKIYIIATIDGRRDGDHTNDLDIIANVYHQPQTAQITVTPNSFTVTSVKVTVKDNDHGSSQCKSVNDPHMMTFDGQHYNNMLEGEFVLFRHTSLPFEVRAIYYKCSKRSHATCNCAVAVKSGDDVITITGCQGTVHGGHPGQGHGIGLLLQQVFGHHGHAHGHNDELAKTPMTIQIYKNGQLTPGTYIRRIGCGQKYEIELPTGMVVTVQQSWKPFINIWIKASSSDRGQSEGLCGNYDGSRNNDLKPNTNAVINKWKVSTSTNFFYGVGVSSYTVTSTFCSCVKGREGVCLAGLGAQRCTNSRNDVTTTLVRQAKRPILARHKRQANTEQIVPTTIIPTDEPEVSLEEAEEKCRDKIMGSTITKSCTPILTSNMTQQIDNCAHDYNATGNFEWATDALRDIIVDCVDAANTIRVANETGNTNVTEELDLPDNIDDILDNLDVCVEDCGEHGNCTDGVCVCDDGYSGISCDISKDTIPTVFSAPFLCDVMDTSDCMAAPVYGDNFVESASLTCHYEFVKIGETVVSTGEKSHTRAIYISINHITCPLPRKQSARISISNDGTKQSNVTTVHVVFNPICFECTETPTCARKDNSCLINNECYASEETRPGDACQICRPVANSTAWSKNNIDECLSVPVAIVKDNDKEKTQILALAITCGVLAAIVFIGCIYCVRSKMGGNSKKEEIGEYDFTGSQKIHRDPFMSRDNPTYVNDEKM